ncbi:MAG: radical SAM protein [Nanoarchaeota archaeon]|nr:radical SAM protein [Nanoarchaeota archaeon]
MNNAIKTISLAAKKATASTIINLTSNLSDQNLMRISSLIPKLTKNEFYLRGAKNLRKIVTEKGAHLKLIRNLNQQLHPNVKKKLINNLILNTLILGVDKRKEYKKNYGYRPPALLVIDVTDRCNLRCSGCWAGNYHEKEDISIELLDRIFKEAKEMGIYFVTLTGGEPFVRKDLCELFKRHKDISFLVYTNGTCITKDIAQQLADFGNVAAAISVEGFEKETDERRGNGVHKRILETMQYLKEAGVLFGFSTMLTNHNSELIGSDKFVDYYLDKGCNFGWLFQYIPIGREPDIKLMATPEQRNELRKRIRKIREVRPIFLGDFWNDGYLVGGCMAGGLNYLHITNNGQVEPCVFAHFSVDNIKEKSLKQVLESDFFRAIRKAHPYTANKNLLAPCMIIDTPQVLRGLAKKYNAKPSHPEESKLIEDTQIIDHLNNYSRKYKEIVDPVWDNEYRNWKEFWFEGIMDYMKK